METIYVNTGFLRRMNLSAGVVVAAFLFGFWELWSAMNPGPTGPGYGFLFAALFIGGGIYAMRQLLVDHAGTVVRLDVDNAANAIVLYLWRPFRSQQVKAGLDGLSDWRFENRTVRANVQVPTLVADHPDVPHPLHFELGKGITISEELRTMAPDAVATSEKYSL